MRVFGMRVQIIGLTFLLIFGGALAAGQWAYEKRVRSPLEDSLLTVAGVESVSVEPAAGLRSLSPSDVRVRLSREADLEHVYLQLEQLAEEALGPRLGEIRMDDDRDASLEEALRAMRFSIEEAVVTGHFRRMSEDIAAIASEHALDDVRVSMDRRFIYLTLVREEAYLHHLVARDLVGPTSASGASAGANAGGFRLGRSGEGV